MATRLVFVDTETGSLDPVKGALLTIGYCAWQDGLISQRGQFSVAAEGREVWPEALAINRIDLVAHETRAISRADAAERFVAEMRARWSGRGKVRLAGHNVPFDIAFLRELVGGEVWGEVVHHRYVDTLQVLTFLQHAGRVPRRVAKFESAIEHFGLDVDMVDLHTAVGDAVSAAKLYERLLRMVV